MAKLKVDGALFDVPTDFTLGDMRAMKRFGVADVTGASATDPDMIAALIYISMRRADPSVTEDVVDTIREVEFIPDEEDADVAGPPPSAAANGNGAAAPLSSATTPAVSGSPS